MRILVACEESGTVTDTLIAAGHDAWSCDLKPTRGDNPGKHIQGNVFDFLGEKWDALIAFPECTYMANSGAKHLYLNMKKENGINPERWENMRKAALFFKYLWEADIPFIAIENPQMLGYAKDIIGSKETQVIQPYEYGHPETKKTYLWLKGFPKLTPTNIVEGREQRVWRMPPGPNRKRDRSKTYQGIADAMVAQWFPLDVSEAENGPE